MMIRNTRLPYLDQWAQFNRDPSRIGRDMLAWSDFEKPHQYWFHSDFGILEFDPSKYCKQLEKLPTQNKRMESNG